MEWVLIGGLAASLAAAALFDWRARRHHRLRTADDMVRGVGEAGDASQRSPGDRLNPVTQQRRPWSLTSWFGG